MSEKKYSETLEQRKKAQQAFLELKKMQQGEIAPEETQSQVDTAPQTFSDKVKNYWYHYKVHTLLTLFVAAVLAIGVVQCATAPQYDAKIALYTNDYYLSDQTEFLADYFAQYYTDINGDGEVTVQMLDCSYTTEGNFDSDLARSQATKLNSLLASDENVLLFIVDEKNFEHLDGVFTSVDNFFTDSAALPSDAYEEAEEKGLKLPNNLIVGKRVVKGTLLEKTENIETISAAADDVLAHLKDKNAE